MRRVVGDQPEEHEARAERGLGEHEEHAGGGAHACGMAGLRRAPRPAGQRHDAEQREAARQPVRELDQRRADGDG